MPPQPRRLLALDLDGTLLRADGSIDPRDRAAVALAIRAGVAVTLATGRVATGTLPTAQALALETPIVCGDGALIVSARTGERLEQRALQVDVVVSVVDRLREHGLAAFVLHHDAIHCDETGRQHLDYVRGWTAEVSLHGALHETDAWRVEGEVALTVGIGDRDGVDAAHDALDSAHRGAVDLTRFRLNRAGHWVLLSRPPGCSKAAGLARVAEWLGIEAADSAVVGDWFNDVSMFAWAGRSFAMAHAPESVRRAASDVLDASGATGGGVAEAVEKWLDSGSVPPT